EKLAFALLAQLVLAQCLALRLEMVPQRYIGQKIGFGMAKTLVLFVRRLLLVDRPLARILHAERAGDDQHLPQRAAAAGLEQHPRHSRIGRQTRQQAPARSELAPLVDSTQLFEQRKAVADLARIGSRQKGEAVDIAEAQRQQLQDHRRQVGTQYFRIGERCAPLKVELAVEPHTDARSKAAAAPLALLGAGLRDRLDRQPLQLRAKAVAADARQPGIDDIADAGYGQ